MFQELVAGATFLYLFFSFSFTCCLRKAEKEPSEGQKKGDSSRSSSLQWFLLFFLLHSFSVSLRKKHFFYRLISLQPLEKLLCFFSSSCFNENYNKKSGRSKKVGRNAFAEQQKTCLEWNVEQNLKWDDFEWSLKITERLQHFFTKILKLIQIKSLEIDSNIALLGHQWYRANVNPLLHSMTIKSQFAGQATKINVVLQQLKNQRKQISRGFKRR